MTVSERMDTLVQKCTAQPSWAALVKAGIEGYSPTFCGSKGSLREEKALLGLEFDMAMKDAGSESRANMCHWPGINIRGGDRPLRKLEERFFPAGSWDEQQKKWAEANPPSKGGYGRTFLEGWREWKDKGSGTIYGVSGHHRYYVRHTGEVVFSASHASKEAVVAAAAMGFTCE